MTTAAAQKIQLEPLKKGLKVRLRVRGLSMVPTIWPGETVTVRPATSPKVGDIAYMGPLEGPGGPYFIVHRIIEATPDHVTTQGDSNTEPDRPMPWSLAAGIVESRRRLCVTTRMSEGPWRSWITSHPRAAHKINRALARVFGALIRAAQRVKSL